MNYKDIDKIDKNINSLDSLSPYVGKMRTELADWIIDNFADNSGLIYDPFSGSGTVLLEGWRKGHCVIGTDLNDYAIVLSKGKTNPYERQDLAIQKLETYNYNVRRWLNKHNEVQVPDWVKEFYNPNTLREICAWSNVLKNNKEWFLLSCLLGILHHQRPGFLSYPSSHGAPYLRINKYPPKDYPEMYQYREVYPRLLAKVLRVYKNIPEFNYEITREVYKNDASKFKQSENTIGTIITSPPYMKSLTYARDNRLRLWFLGNDNWKDLDRIISPDREYFFRMMSNCFKKWYQCQVAGGRCILVVGNIITSYNGKKISIPEALIDIATDYYRLIDAYIDPIPEKRKIVKGDTQIKQEIILVFERR